MSLKSKIKSYEKDLLVAALEREHWDVRATSIRLEVSERTLWRRLARHGIVPAEHRNLAGVA